MTDKNEIIEQVDAFFNETYEITDGRAIPDVDDISLDNEGTELELAMLFIDINESTKIVDGIRRTTAAKMYKSFLWGIAKIARLNQGELRSFNGDGVLVAFNGDNKRTHATKAALQMNWFVGKVLKSKIQDYLDKNNAENWVNFSCGIGIDVGEIMVVRGGIRGENNNDLVWVGNATNYAVKLAKIGGEDIFVSKNVYSGMLNSSKYKNGNPHDTDMWKKYTWTQMNDEEIYGSSWIWAIS